MNRFIRKLIAFLFPFALLNVALQPLIDSHHDLLRFEVFAQKRWNDFYSLPNNSLDVLFVGSSHAYVTFNPDIVDTTLHVRSFNLGGPAQTPITTYYVLKEALRFQRPRVVVLDLFWGVFHDNEQFSGAICNLPYMKSSDVRTDFLMHGLTAHDYLLLGIPLLRYRPILPTFLRSLFPGQAKGESEYRYASRGYVESTVSGTSQSLKVGNPYRNLTFDQAIIGRQCLAYLDRIVSMCRRNGISVLFVSAPLPPATLSLITNYSDIHEYFQGVARQYGVPYLDFSMGVLKEGRLQDKDFCDSNHTNSVGARKTSELLCSELRPLLAR